MRMLLAVPVAALLCVSCLCVFALVAAFDGHRWAIKASERLMDSLWSLCAWSGR